MGCIPGLLKPKTIKLVLALPTKHAALRNKRKELLVDGSYQDVSDSELRPGNCCVSKQAL